jgi:hypothetical protein
MLATRHNSRGSSQMHADRPPRIASIHMSMQEGKKAIGGRPPQCMRDYARAY